MKKILKWVGLGVLILGALWAAAFFVKSNGKSTIEYETHNPFISSIEKKTVATGKVIPEDEIEIKPQISGIIDKIYLEEGVRVKAGDLIATIKVVPNEQALYQARGRVNNAKVNLSNAELDFNRNKTLFDKGVVSAQDFQNIELTYNQAKLEKVDEGEVGKLEVGMPLEISLGAIDDKKFDANLKFIAPKGVEEAGAVQFKIEGDVKVDESVMIRAGYSANASLILEKKDSILVIPEALLQFDRTTNKPYVEISTGEQQFERRDIEIGISDGVNVEIVSGLEEGDNVKQWNKTEPIKKGLEDEEEDSDEAAE